MKQTGRKPNKIWVDQGGEFYNRDFKKWLWSNSIIMYSTYNEGKSVVVERFIRTLKNKLYKHMTATDKTYIIMFWMMQSVNIIILNIVLLK